MILKQTLSIFVISFFTFLLFPIGAQAIDFSNSNAKRFSNQTDFDETSQLDLPQSFSSFSSSSLRSKVPESVDNAVDPERYLIGTGDGFYISILDNPSLGFTGTLNQQGDLFIAELGLVKLGKMSLSEAQKQISKFVQTKLKKVTGVYVSLLKAKTASISINGAVLKPGTYKIPGTYRVLDALRAANNNEIPSLNNCNFREVRCSNNDSLKTIDLFEYLLKNKMDGNPYIYPGDNITLDYAPQKIFLNCPSREVVSGMVPIKANEKLSDFLSFFTFDKSVDTTIVLLETSLPSDGRAIKTIPWNETNTIVLQDHDVITGRLPGPELTLLLKTQQALAIF